MADSAGQVSSKTSEKNKFSNSVARTTSETLRISEADKSVTQPSSLSTSTSNPRKKTSFQITSVTVVGSRASNDGGDDSADDLDESHTDDISEVIDVSRDIENETPSYSEDTFSKDDVFFNASASLGTAPVIPTSSQYGLAILATPDNCETNIHPADNCGNSVSGTDLHMGVTENVINLGVVSTKPDPEMRDIHTHQARHERFKVVKIESTEPFKRGRWVCMDYLDHSISQPKSNSSKTDSNVSKCVESKQVEHNEHSTQNYSTTESISTTDTITNLGTPNTEEPLPPCEQISNTVSVSMSQMENTHQLPINLQNLPSTYSSSVSPGQSLQSNIQIMNPGINTSTSQTIPQQAQSLSQVPIQQPQPSVATNQHTSLQPQQIQQVIASANVIPVQQQPQTSITNQQPLVQQTMPQMQPIQQQQQQTQFQQQFQPMQQQQQPIIQQQIPQQMQVHMQNVQQSMHVQQPQGQSLPQPMMTQQTMQPQLAPQMHQVSFSQPLPQQTITQTTAQPQVQGMMQQMHPQQIQGFQTQMIQPAQSMINVQSAQPHLQQQYYSNMQPMQGMNSQSGMLPPMSQGSSMPQVSMHGGTTGHIPMTSYPITSIPSQMIQQSMQQTPPVATSVPSYPIQFPAQPPHQAQQPAPQSLPASAPQPVISTQMVPPGYVSVGGSTGAQTYVQSVVSSVPSVDLVQTTQMTEASMLASEQGNPPSTALLESLAEVTNSPEEPPAGEESESATGASAVAIDNKIEQAMDLVKSHLMFAVREEVEVLKEKIAELMDRINQLEVENSILRANATQETLSQLPPPPSASQQQPANPP